MPGSTSTGQQLPGAGVYCLVAGGTLVFRKGRLANDGMHPEIAVDDLGNAKVDGDGNQRDGFIFAERVFGHQVVASLAKGIAHGGFQ